MTITEFQPFLLSESGDPISRAIHRLRRGIEKDPRLIYLLSKDAEFAGWSHWLPGGGDPGDPGDPASSATS